MNPSYYPLKKQTARQVNIPRGVYNPDSKEGKTDPYFGQHNSILYQRERGNIDFDYIPIVFIINGKSYELLGSVKNYQYDDKFGITTMTIGEEDYDILYI